MRSGFQEVNSFTQSVWFMTRPAVMERCYTGRFQSLAVQRTQDRHFRRDRIGHRPIGLGRPFLRMGWQISRTPADGVSFVKSG